MEKKRREWFDKKYVLSYFGKKASDARRRYLRVSKIYGIEKTRIYTKGCRKIQVEARDFFRDVVKLSCFQTQNNLC